MKTLLNPEHKQEIINRLHALNPTDKAVWGKMDVAQMLAHCTKPLQLAITNPKPPRQFMGRIFGKMSIPSILGPKPFKQNGFTPKEFLITTPQDFKKQKETVLTLVSNFSSDAIGDTNHPFFGPLTVEQWGEGNFKHLDWHLTQFGK